MRTADTEVAPGIRAVALPLPLALRAINVYLIEGTHGWSLVDTGMHTPEAESALRAALADAGVVMSDVTRTFVTHVHPDHIGMAGTLAAAGSEIAMHGPEADHARRLWSSTGELVDQAYRFFDEHGMPRDVDEEMRRLWLATARNVVDPLPEIRKVADGDAIDLGGRSFRVIWTPGHTDHHAVLYDEGERVLVAGDHVLPHITSNISLYPWSRPDPLGDYLASLRSVARLDVRRVLPAHGGAFDDLTGRVAELLEHHDRRLERVREFVRSRSRDAYSVARALFPRLRDAHEERFALAETLAHLRHLELAGAVARTEGAPIGWREVAAP